MSKFLGLDSLGLQNMGSWCHQSGMCKYEEHEWHEWHAMNQPTKKYIAKFSFFLPDTAFFL